MALVPWRPFGDIDRWFDEEWPDLWGWPEMGFPKVPAIRTPRMDIYEKGNNVVAEIELPGVDPKKISVEVKDNILMVEARAEEKKEEKGKGYYRKEMGTRYFRRQAPLPSEVVGNKAEAEYEDGVLTVTIPKAKKKATPKRKIKVKVKKSKK